MYCILIPKPHKNTTGKHHKQKQEEKPDKPISLAYVDSMEKSMAPHSSTLAWKIPWTEEPGRL